MLQGPQAQTIKLKKESGDYKPDWAGAFKRPPKPKTSKFSGQAPEICLPGDTKLRRKVDFNLLNEEVDKTGILDFRTFRFQDPAKQKKCRRESLRDKKEVAYDAKFMGVRLALIQVYSYRVESKSRYGYVITEIQLLVMRIRPHSSSIQSTSMRAGLIDNGLFEYRTISYNRSDRSKHCVNSALWWLHLLAAMDHEIYWQYKPLMEIVLKSHTTITRIQTREISEEYEAPPDSQLIESQLCDLRRPGPKRKQSSQHDSGQRNNPSPHDQQATILSARDLQTEPDLSLEMIPTPPRSKIQSEQRKPSQSQTDSTRTNSTRQAPKTDRYAAASSGPCVQVACAVQSSARTSARSTHNLSSVKQTAIERAAADHMPQTIATESYYTEQSSHSSVSQRRNPVSESTSHREHRAPSGESTIAKTDVFECNNRACGTQERHYHRVRNDKYSRTGRA